MSLEQIDFTQRRPGEMGDKRPLEVCPKCGRVGEVLQGEELGRADHKILLYSKGNFAMARVIDRCMWQVED